MRQAPRAFSGTQLSWHRDKTSSLQTHASLPFKAPCKYLSYQLRRTNTGRKNQANMIITFNIYLPKSPI